MPESPVYFCDLRTRYQENLPAKLIRLLDTAGLADVVGPRNLVAIKLHFGEKGNTAFIRPLFFRRIVERLKELKTEPFLTDTNTLYAGTRGNSVSHMRTAVENGFAYSVVDAPVIIADGMRGASYAEVPVNLELIRSAYVGKEIYESDALLSVAHFKGHELSGFGGTIKNIGMGCAARRGKLAQHSDLSPKVKRKKCVACGDCIRHCAQQAISLVDEKAQIDPERCVGCGECILVCPNGAINIQWDTEVPAFQRKMAEYTAAVLENKKDRCLFVNFITDVSPACDCLPNSDAPIVQDIGILASKDPVAIDQASVDLVNQHQVCRGSCLIDKTPEAEDKFRTVYPKVDWSVQLDHAEKIGLGNRSYSLNRI